MAKRRMFSLDVVDTDNFLNMPCSARLLYYDLGMHADDDGFLQNVNKIMRSTGATKDDMNVLIARGFIIPFESGIVVIRHWKLNNQIKPDRYKQSVCLAELKQIGIDESKEYVLLSEHTEASPLWNHSGSITEPQVRRGKDRSEKSRGGYSLPAASDMSQDSKGNVDIVSLIKQFNLFDCPSTHKELGADLKKVGEKKLLEALSKAAEKNSRDHVSVAFYRTILYGSQDPYANYPTF